MIAYKLFKIRKDGSIGSLFINASVKLPIGEWMQAEDHPTKRFTHRPGWHATLLPIAPHLLMETSTQKRAWYMVELKDVVIHKRPPSQGGEWALAQQMQILGKLK